MKKQRLLCALILTFALLGLVVCTAAAEVLVDYIKDGSVTLDPVSGLKLVRDKTGYNEETGKWNIVVDSENTNWESVVQNGLSSMGITLLDFCYTPVPGNAVSVAALGMHNDTASPDAYQWYQENLHYLNNTTNLQSLDRASLSLYSGYYNADTGLYFPQEYTDAMYSAFGFRWKLQDDTYKAEHSLYTLSFEPAVDSVSVPLR